MKNITKIFLISILGGVITLSLYKVFFEEPVVQTIINEPSTPSIQTNSKSFSPFAETSFTAAAEKTVNSVVHVKTAVEARLRQPSSPLEYFFGRPNGNSQGKIQLGSGSGVIVSKDGYIVTNNHVIDGAQEISITLNDGREFNASLIGKDPTTDIALLKIEGEGLPYLTFSNSDDVKLGEWVLAVGNPFNLTSTVTAGIISAKSRNIGIIEERSAIEAFLQTDAAVNPGNSGGALVNTKGDLIGINSAISTHTGSFEGYSFAVPSNIVKKVVEDLLEFGTVQRAFIGVNISDISAQIAERLDLKETVGVYVGGVTENGAAEVAGIKTGDVIVSIDNKQVKKSSELQELIGRKRPGDKIEVKVNREGDLQKFDIVLRNINGNTDAIKRNDTKFISSLGGRFKSLSKIEKARLGITYGIRVTEIQSGILAELGIPKNFIITKINKNKLSQVEDINEAVKGLKSKDPVVLEGYLPNGRYKYYAFGF
tara:strand:+ start:92731 stop:94179 length:1449 start_codon:yes stop_codon:yes gene_type:complete